MTNRKSRDRSYGIVPYRRYEDGVMFLLVQHIGGHWAFPKGHAEKGETPLEAACRELQEETGVGVADVLEDVFFEETYIIRRRSGSITKTVTYWPAEVDDNRVYVQESEIQAYAWLPFETALLQITFPEAQRLLRDVATILTERKQLKIVNS